METRRYKVLLEWDVESEAWVTYVPALGHMSTYGESRGEALEQTKEAILGYLEAARKDGLPIPKNGAELEIVEVEIATA